jgi:hypothetical protein
MRRLKRSTVLPILHSRDCIVTRHYDDGGQDTVLADRRDLQDVLFDTLTVIRDEIRKDKARLLLALVLASGAGVVCWNICDYDGTFNAIQDVLIYIPPT